MRSTSTNIRTLLPPDVKQLYLDREDSPPSTATTKNVRLCGVVSRNEECNFSFSAMRQDKGWGTDGLHVVPKLLSSEEVCCGSVGSLDVLQAYSVYKNVETRKNILIRMKEIMYSRALDQSWASKVS